MRDIAPDERRRHRPKGARPDGGRPENGQVKLPPAASAVSGGHGDLPIAGCVARLVRSPRYGLRRAPSR
jgi:hypothetical protein